MPIKGSTIYLQLPNASSKRVLHPLDVTDVSGKESITVLPQEQDLALEPGTEVIIYFDHKQQFLQQPAKIEALLEGEQGTLATLQTVGEPVSAESRQCFRVSTALADLTINFNGEQGCKLRDVSVTGFAVLSSKKYEPGQVVDVELLFEGKRYHGQASIQSVSQTPEGLYRYGTNCVKTANKPDSISKGMQVVSMSVQRQQLNRLAGGA